MVGSGPVGLVSAALLGAEGIPTLVVEKNRTTSNEAKAISIDDESLRVLQRAGVLDAVYPIILPGTGTKYYGADGRLLVHARGAVPYRLGHPTKNPFAQPDLERTLLEALGGYTSVEVRFGVELVDLSQSGTGVTVVVNSAEDGGTASIQADYVLGCDGGRSKVRELLGIQMTGSSFEETWLVVDTINDAHRERYGMHHGDPRRPHVIIPGSGGRCRYEFKLAPGESPPGIPPPLPLVQHLLSPYRQARAEDVERCTSYRFHALVADRWQDGRAFLLGDAAHMMPPFAGQGLNSGFRDADNLTWKIAAVLAGRTAEVVLSTYEPERRPHAESMVKLSTRLGQTVMTSNRLVAASRDAIVRAVNRTNAGRSYLGRMGFKPPAVYRSGLVLHDFGDSPQELAGRMLEQPRCLDATGRLLLLDDVLGPGFAVIGVALGDDEWSKLDRGELRSFGCRFVDVALDDTMAVDGEDPVRQGIADADGRLQTLLGPYRGTALLVRPDRYVAAIIRLAEVSNALTALEQFLPGVAPGSA